ncbi:MAG: apolipoprotein N-acyltransferase [Candidatus Marinimicrobia bacterium]|nr:apolipoprotein N-acyltransferase [Candidatus Neomarinimicrobiota bacterium]|tara:strand:+ start:173 stop:1558 length:1386 start_codon:yes stop_codon:yes gene_type:complete
MTKKNLMLSLMSGLMLGLSFPPFHLGFLAWIFLIPLFKIFNQSIKLSEKIILFYLAGFISNAIITHWVALNSGTSVQVAIISYLALCIFYSIYWILFCLILHFFEKRKLSTKIQLLLIPFIWVVIENLRDIGPLAAPWLNFSLTQTGYNRLIQIVSVHVDLSSFIIILLNVLFYKFISLKQKIYIYSFLSVILINALIGQILITNYNTTYFQKQINVSIGQPVIYPDEKWNPNLKNRNEKIMNDLLQKSLESNPDVIVWPEAALTSFLSVSDSKVRMELQEKIEDSVLITGIPQRMYFNNELKVYNSAIFLRPDGFYDTYQKIFLVPFAEYVPFFKNWLSKINQFDDMGSFSPGENYNTFTIGDVKLSILICYDSSSFKIAKKMVDKGAEIIFVITNDSYVGKAMPYQHFEHAKLRSIELGIPVVQSANNGISGIILPSGEVLIKSEIDDRNVYNHLIELK